MEHDTPVEKIDLLGYWPTLVRRRWAIYLSVVVFALIALVGSFLITPMFRASAVLRIERQSPDILNVREVTRTDFAWNAYADFYQTQYKILASLPVARLAADRLALTGHPELNRPPERSFRSVLRDLLPSKKGPAVEEPDPLDVAARWVQGGLQISPVRNSQLVRVSWSHEDPELAARIADGVAAAYIQFNMGARHSTTGLARQFLDDQIGELKVELEGFDNELQQYGESKNIVSIDDASNLTLQALQRISEERTAAETALARAKAAYDAISQASPAALPEVLSSTLISNLRSEYAELEARYAEGAERFKPDWPEMQTLESKMGQARERLELETRRIADQVLAVAESDYQRALQESRSMNRLVDSHQNSAQRLKRDAVRYANLLSEVREKRSTLEALIQRRNEMDLQTRLKDLDDETSNIQIVEAAQRPTAPYRPRTRTNVFLATLLGLGFGVGLALVLDHLDNTVVSPTQLEALLSVPVLSVIPRHGKRSPAPGIARRRPALAEAANVDMIVHRDGRAAVAEAYRGLRTSILLSNPGQPPRRIVLTSAVPEEGKTATASNLAIVLAQLGRRVLLVDTDLRRPRLHRAFGVGAERGVSTFLSGLEKDPCRLVVSTGIEGLDLMPSGPIPPNPSELLNSSVFGRMGDELLAAGYDHIVFDSPPVLSVSDPVIIATVCDRGVLVVRAGATPRQSVVMAAERLGQTETHFGVVLNDLDLEAPGSGYARYQSYDSYGHDQDDREREDVLRNAGSGHGA